MSIKTFFFFVCVICIISCKSHKQAVIETAPFNKIGFGAKGGFTGKGKEYVLYPSGQVYENKSGNLELINTARKTELDSIIKKIEEIKFKDITLSETGNLTFHIYYEGTYTNTVSWCDLSQNELMKLFNLLSATAKIK